MMGSVWFALGILFGVSLMMGATIISYYESKFQKDSQYTDLDKWYRIEHNYYALGEERWAQTLIDGKPSKFERLVDAFLCLRTKPHLWHPGKQRIIRVTEEIVNYDGRTSGRTTGAEGFAGDGGKQGSDQQDSGEVASQGRIV